MPPYCQIDFFGLIQLRVVHEHRQSNIMRREYIKRYGQAPAYEEYPEDLFHPADLVLREDNDMGLVGLSESDKVSRLDDILHQIGGGLTIIGVQYGFLDETCDDESGR